MAIDGRVGPDPRGRPGLRGRRGVHLWVVDVRRSLLLLLAEFLKLKGLLRHDVVHPHPDTPRHDPIRPHPRTG